MRADGTNRNPCTTTLQWAEEVRRQDVDTHRASYRVSEKVGEGTDSQSAGGWRIEDFDGHTCPA
ncbi:hypothetical protein D3C83_142560 [compost metagenome]